MSKGKDTSIVSIQKKTIILEERYGLNGLGKVLWINYLLATIHTVELIREGGGSIFDSSGKDYSKIFLVRRLKKLNDLLSPFTNEYCELKKKISIIEEDLDGKLFEFEYRGKTGWLNRNGFCSHYREYLPYREIEEGDEEGERRLNEFYYSLGSKIKENIESLLINPQ